MSEGLKDTPAVKVDMNVKVMEVERQLEDGKPVRCQASPCHRGWEKGGLYLPDLVGSLVCEGESQCRHGGTSGRFTARHCHDKWPRHSAALVSRHLSHLPISQR